MSRNSVEFDSDEDPETCAERFEKFLPKVKSVTLINHDVITQLLCSFTGPIQITFFCNPSYLLRDKTFSAV